MANKIKHLLDAYQKLQADGQDCVMATIVETSGSTYQKAGARMLIDRDGELTGLLGGGCFERDLVEQAATVFATGIAKTVFYDMRSADDVIWGLGLGCNGAVRVLLQLLRATEDFSPLQWIVESAAANLSGVLATVLESVHADFPVGHSQFLPAATVAKTALQAYLQQKPSIENDQLNGLAVTCFYDPIQTPWQLLIVGAGVDAMPLLQCAHALGWRVTLVDYRPAHIRPERFPNAERLMQSLPEELAQRLDLNRYQALMLMTHNVEYDQRYLQAMLDCTIPFIGLLGPTARKQRLLTGLGEAAEQIRSRVFGPVGLDIAAQTPAEIALSIMAGIHAHLNGRSGQQLSHPASASAYDYSH